MKCKKVLETPICVLSKCRKTLSFCNLYEKCDRQFYLLAAPKFHLMHVLWIFYTVMIAILLWSACVQSYHAVNVSVAIGTIQLLFIYHSLLCRKQSICKCIDGLQAIVDQRCQRSFAAYEVYKASEAKCSLITQRVIKGAAFSGISFIVLIASSPISYWLFGFPAPDKWLKPNGFRFVHQIMKFSRIFLDSNNFVCVCGSFQNAI